MLIGAMLGELRGIQAGLIAGIVLTILPTTFHAAARLVGPDGIVRACVREIGGIVVDVAAAAIDTSSRIPAPLRLHLQGPATFERWTASRVIHLGASVVGQASRLIVTPQGIANLGAALVVACELGELDIAPAALFAGFGAVLLLLLVAASERAP
jgi:hypothetical protein